jgi:hypothetical protein
MPGAAPAGFPPATVTAGVLGERGVSLSSVGLFRGPCHVVEYMAPDLIDFFGIDATGMPFREAFAEPMYGATAAVFDRVYATGVAEEISRPVGLVTVLPWRSHGQVQGVSAHVLVAARPRRRRLAVPVGAPASRE